MFKTAVNLHKFRGMNFQHKTVTLLQLYIPMQSIFGDAELVQYSEKQYFTCTENLFYLLAEAAQCKAFIEQTSIWEVASPSGREKQGRSVA